MEFRPCIDIHNGAVKQIVGGSLRDAGDTAKENFVSEQDAAFYARLYQKLGIRGGHVILLNPVSSEYYEATKSQAFSALQAWPGGLQAGGGITPENAADFLDAGASHVIVTSYVFRDGSIDYARLNRMVETVGREHLVLDLSCRKYRPSSAAPVDCPSGSAYTLKNSYYVVTDRWQKFTDTEVTPDTLRELSAYCDEFLIHAADVEGKQGGVDAELISILSQLENFPITYAGGVGSFADLDILKTAGRDRLNVTIGSALDLFGGSMPLTEVLAAVNHDLKVAFN
ncbi:MAG: phosphoribosylformimino-5-aminoimidazole carboxamide ribotide isomerase [Eubacterium sp.]|nr:phosphoribosylformimino-5-aminoimidazole carboxamide ribotide isomerase [Eubacterium sp.]